MQLDEVANQLPGERGDKVAVRGPNVDVIIVTQGPPDALMPEDYLKEEAHGSD